MKALRLTAAIVVCATAIFWSSGTASAGDNPSLTVDVVPTSGPAGTVVDVSGLCFEDTDQACDGVDASLLDPDGLVVDSFSTDDNEPEFAGQLTVPDDAVCGDYIVLVEGIEGGVIIDEEVVFQVTTECPPIPTDPDPSASTSEATQAAAETRPTFTG